MNILAISAVLICALSGSACTTLKPTEATPDEVQRQLIAGELIQPGSRVRLVTSDEAVYEFRVKEIDVETGYVIGPDEKVPIAEIIGVETREVSVGKTALLVGGLGYSIIAIALILTAPALILGGG